MSCTWALILLVPYVFDWLVDWLIISSGLSTQHLDSVLSRLWLNWKCKLNSQIKWLIKVSLCHFCFSDFDLNENTRDTESVCGRSEQGFSQSDIGGKKIQRQEGDGEEQSVRFVSILWLAMWSQVMWLVSWCGPALFTISLSLFFHFPTVILLLWNNLKQLKQSKSETAMYDTW